MATRGLSAWARRTPYWAFYLALAAFLLGLSYLFPSPDGMPAPERFEKRAESMLDAVSSITSMVSTLTTTLCAAAAAVAVKGREWSAAWQRIDGFLTLSVLLAGAVSYYAQYTGAVAILEMVAAGGFCLCSPKLSSAIGVQYYALLVGYFLLGMVFCRLMESRRLGSPPE